MEVNNDFNAARYAIKEMEKVLGEQPEKEMEKFNKDIQQFTQKLLYKYRETEPYYDIEKLKKVVNEIFGCKDAFDEDHKTYNRALEDGAIILEKLLNNKISYL